MDCHSNILVDYLDLREARLKEQIMSELSDKIAEVKTATDEAVERVRADVEELQSQIEELRGRVTTPEDIAALEEIKGKANALDPVKPDTLPPG